VTALKAHQVEGFLKRPDIEEGVFLAYGPDAGLVRETAETLARRFAKGDPEALVMLDGDALDKDPGRLALEAKTPSLFGGARVIRVRDAGKAIVPVLAELIDDMAGTAIVLEAGNLAPRDALRAFVEGSKAGRALPCYSDSDETLQKLIAEAFAKAGVALDPDVAPTLRDILGNDREVTRRELDKLLLFAESTRRLTRADVLALCADNAALVIDEIADAAGTGHAAKLDEALTRALAAAIDPQRVLSTLMSHFAMLRRWRIEVDAGRSPRDVLAGSRSKPHFSRIRSVEQQLTIWSDAALAAAGERLLQATADSRRVYGTGDAVVRRTLLAIAIMANSH
jgi:DNA polymerase-3 subunit delta